MIASETTPSGPTADRENFLHKIRAILKEIDICVLSTEGRDSTIHSRPMALQAVDFDGTLWFFTGQDSEKLKELAMNQSVTVTAINPTSKQCAVLVGKGELSNERKKMKDLWNPLYGVWFPDGLEDPNLRLLRIDVDEAEYWDWQSGVFAYLSSVIKAVTSGGDGKNTHDKKDL